MSTKKPIDKAYLVESFKNYQSVKIDPALENKVDKETGKSLVDDTDIAQITTNKDAIETLNGDDETTGSVAKQIKDAVKDITGFEYEVVDTLPETGVKGKIYLIANSGSGQNIYDEYIWVGDKYEKLGTTEIDISGKVDKNQGVASAGKALIVGSGGLVTLTAVDTTPTSGSSNPVTSGGVYTALSGKSPLAGSSSLTTCSKGTFGDASTKGVTSSATSGSADLITSGGVYSSLANKQDKLTNPLTKSDVVNNLTSTATDVPLSAYQGNVLNTALSKKAQFDNNTLVAIGDDVLIGDQNVAGTLIVQGNNGKGNIELRNTDGTKITSVLDMYTTLSKLGTQATMTLSGTTLTITF